MILLLESAVIKASVSGELIIIFSNDELARLAWNIILVSTSSWTHSRLVSSQDVWFVTLEALSSTVT